MTPSEAGKLGYTKTRQHLERKRDELKYTAVTQHEAAARRCGCCGTLLTYEKRRNKFCSHSCAAAINNQGIVRNGIARERRTHCLRCGEQISGAGYLYCSKACASTHRADKFAERLVSNSPDVGHGSPASVRRHLIKLRGEQCEECGWNKRHPITDRVPLEVDHVDGNYKNNRMENLKLLCPNCHSLTLTFRNLNKGNGRKFRQKAPE